MRRERNLLGTFCETVGILDNPIMTKKGVDHGNT
jgi:hypothetical protein